MKATTKRVLKPSAEPAPEIVTQPIHQAMLEQLRAGNAQIEAIKATMQASVGGYVAGCGLSLDTHNIEFNIESGVMRIYPKMPASTVS